MTNHSVIRIYDDDYIPEGARLESLYCNELDASSDTIQLNAKLVAAFHTVTSIILIFFGSMYILVSNASMEYCPVELHTFGFVYIAYLVVSVPLIIVVRAFSIPEAVLQGKTLKVFYETSKSAQLKLFVDAMGLAW